MANVRFGSLADIDPFTSHVCFTPESGHWLSLSECPLCANNGHRFCVCRVPLTADTRTDLATLGRRCSGFDLAQCVAAVSEQLGRIKEVRHDQLSDWLAR